MTKNILITGVTGFLGVNLARNFLKMHNLLKMLIWLLIHSLLLC